MVNDVEINADLEKLIAKHFNGQAIAFINFNRTGTVLKIENVGSMDVGISIGNYLDKLIKILTANKDDRVCIAMIAAILDYIAASKIDTVKAAYTMHLKAADVNFKTDQTKAQRLNGVLEVLERQRNESQN